METDILDDIVNKYNNTYHSIIKMKPVDAKPNTYIDSWKEINNKDPKFKIGYIVPISKIFLQKAVFQIGQRKLFWLKTLLSLSIILKLKKLLKHFLKKNCNKRVESWKRKNEKRW